MSSLLVRPDRGGLLCVVSVAAVLLATRADACECCRAIGVPACGYAGPASGNADGVARFVRQGGRLPGFTGSGNPITVTYSYSNFLDGGLKFPSGASYQANYLRRVTEEAFALWAAVIPIHFVEVPDLAPNNLSVSAYDAADPSLFGQIRISHLPIDGSDVLLNRPTTKARAYFPVTVGNRALDIEFDSSDRWRIEGTGPEPDVLGIMAHEIGHVLGLGHSPLVSAVMHFAPPRRSGPGSAFLDQDDILGVRSIYGAGVGSVTGLVAVPEPATIGLLVGIAIAAATRRRRTW